MRTLGRKLAHTNELCRLNADQTKGGDGRLRDTANGGFDALTASIFTLCAQPITPCINLCTHKWSKNGYSGISIINKKDSSVQRGPYLMASAVAGRITDLYKRTVVPPTCATSGSRITQEMFSNLCEKISVISFHADKSLYTVSLQQMKC